MLRERLQVALLAHVLLLAMPAYSQDDSRAHGAELATMSSLLQLHGESQLAKRLGVIRDSTGRVREMYDHSGVRNVLSYDAYGRVYAITLPSLSRVVVFHYPLDGDAQDRAESVSLIDSSSGRELNHFALRKPQQKYLEVDDPDFQDFLWGYIITLEDPFPSLFDQNWLIWGPKPPIQCSLNDCLSACDQAFGMSGLACGAVAVASSPAGVLCGAVALSAWVSCRNKCTASCS